MVAFERLVEQIDLFIRKYYKNQMIKGLIWFVGIFLFSLLLTTALEYFGRFGSLTRGLLFFGFVATNCYVLFKYILTPLVKLYSFGSRISRIQASEIIGQFFPHISDRLLNTLQLNQDLSQQEGNLELIRASVAQRSESLSAIPFSSAINLSDNKRYLKFVVPIVLFFLGVAVFIPALITEGSERVVNYNKVFIPEAPFNFELNSFSKKVLEGDNIELKLKLVGSEVPDKVYLVSERGKFLMTKDGRNSFNGELVKLVKSGSFYFSANEFVSKQFNYEVLGKPSIGRFEASIVYPSYLGREPEVINNAGDLTVPEGSMITWSVSTKNVESVEIRLNGRSELFKSQGFKFTRKLVNSTDVSVLLTGSALQEVDSSSFIVNVVKDAYPTISVEEVKDSLASGRRFFTGSVSDDYGLSSLNFVYKIVSKDGSTRSNKLNVRSVSGTELPFDFGVDFIRENLKVDDKVEYYFVVSDNDGVNGSKSMRSRVFTYELPSLSELNEKRENEQEDAKNDLKDLLNRTDEFKKDVKRFKKDLLNSKSSDWNKKNQINQLQEEHNDLLNLLEKTQQKLEQSSQEKNQLSETDKQLLEKQELLNDLLEELMDDELKNLLEELEKLLEENRKDELQDKLDKLEMSSEDMNKELDRSLEMLKKLQVDEKIDGIEDELKELAKDQEALKDKIDQKKISKEDAVNEQEKINDRFDEIKEDVKELQKLNEELNRPMNLGDLQTPQDDIDSELNEAQDKLEKGRESKAGESQQGAADEMKKMAENMDQAQQESNSEQQAEDMDMLRAILESLVTLSLDQEWVMHKLDKTNELDPAYRSFGRFQRRVVDNTLPVRDSLLELAKRQPKIAKFIDAELNTIQVNHRLSMDDIDERRKRELGMHQQLAMTSFNNLALMLNEALQSMQSQMQSQMQGSGSCSKPGGMGAPKPGESMNPGNMKEMLKKQLEQMQKGDNPGGKKPGDKPGDQPGTKPGSSGSMGMGGMSNQQIAKMAAEQGAIRRQLEELKNKLNKEGKGQGNQLNPLLNELEKQQDDLINKRFSPEMINRQKEILTRLLESEKALMERGFEEQRESKSGKNENNGNQIRFDEYNKQKLKQIELLRTIDPVYNKYYKDKANQYFNGGL